MLLSRRLALVAVGTAMVYVSLTGTAQTISTQPAKTDQRVEDILRKMTLDEKIDYISGDLSGFATRAIPRLGVPPFRMTDGPLGTRNDGPSTAYAAGIALAATWNTGLAEAVGRQLGRDARARGVDIVLGPGVDIYRSPLNGYNYQHFGEDPFLVSRIAVGYIEGMQSQHVGADIKHLIGNNSEYDRHTTDSIIGERALREIYLPPYEAAVKEAHVATVMNGYNLTNGTYMSANARFNIDLLRKEWGFTGFVMPDWGGTADTVAVANGGMDLEMPTAKVFTRPALLQAIHDGKVSEATIDEKVRNIMTTADRFGWFDHQGPDLSVSRDSWESQRVALEGAREAIVLLKNEGHLLPLDKTKLHSIAVIGPDAHPAQATGAGAAHTQPFTQVSFLEGISKIAEGSPEVFYDEGVWSLNKLANFTDFSTDANGANDGLRLEVFSDTSFQGAPVRTETVHHLNLGGEGGLATDPEIEARDGRHAAVFAKPQEYGMRWSGYYNAEQTGDYVVFVETGEHFGLFIDNKLVIDNQKIAHAIANDIVLPLSKGGHTIRLEVVTGGPDNNHGLRLRMGIKLRSAIVTETAKELARRADVVVLCVGFNASIEGEGHDREYKLPPGQEELIRAIAAENPHVIVVVTSGGSVATAPWLDQVPALLEAWYPGQSGGTAFAEILFGITNPSGRLPITWEKKVEDDPSYPYYYPEPGTNRAVYKEGIFAGYRGFEHNRTAPLFTFGYGLSYSTFTLGDLKVSSDTIRVGEPVTLSFTVTNTGSVRGKEVAELYVNPVNPQIERPEKELKGFVKVDLAPGETKQERITLDSSAFAFYDVDGKRWKVDPGEYNLLLGTSCEDIVARQHVQIHQ